MRASSTRLGLDERRPHPSSLPREERDSAEPNPRPLWWYAKFIRALAPEGGRLLQYGCGEGELLQQLASYFEVFGYDESAPVRHRCRTSATDAVILESFDDIAPASADLVVWLGAVPRNRALQHVRRLMHPLSPGGWLLAITPNPGGLGRRLKGSDWLAQPPAAIAQLPSQGEWVMVLRRAGLMLSSVQGDGMWNAPYLPLIPTDWQRAMFAAPLALSSWLSLSRWLLPVAYGESLVLTARKKS